MKTVFWGRDRSGCTWYRMILPGRALGEYDSARFTVLESHDSPDKADLIIDNADVFIMGRRFGPEAERFVELAKSDGRGVIYDFDDDIFNVSPFNDSYRWFGVEQVQLDVDGQPMDLWVDGQAGFDSKRNQQNLERAKRIMEMVNGLTVTTVELAEIYKPFNSKVAILPNCVDLTNWPRFVVEHQDIRIGWQGGSSHVEDLHSIKEILAELWEDPWFRNNCTFVMVGKDYPSVTSVIPPDRLEVHGWVDVEAHSYRMASLGLDLTLIPLTDTQFNRAKSAIKWVEAAALGVPTVCSNMPPYNQIIKHRTDGLLAIDHHAWQAFIKELAEDTGLRQELGQAAYQTVEHSYDQHHYNRQWDRAIDWMCATG